MDHASTDDSDERVRRGRPFLTGFGLGLLVPPVSLWAAWMWGAAGGVPAFLVLSVAAVAVPRVHRRRVMGVVTGMVTVCAAMVVASAILFARIVADGERAAGPAPQHDLST